MHLCATVQEKQVEAINRGGIEMQRKCNPVQSDCMRHVNLVMNDKDAVKWIEYTG